MASTRAKKLLDAAIYPTVVRAMFANEDKSSDGDSQSSLSLDGKSSDWTSGKLRACIFLKLMCGERVQILRCLVMAVLIPLELLNGRGVIQLEVTVSFFVHLTFWCLKKWFPVLPVLKCVYHLFASVLGRQQLVILGLIKTFVYFPPDIQERRL